MNQKVNYTHLNAGRFDSTNDRHLKVLSLCKQIGWVKLNPKTKKPVADIERLGAFILNSGFVKKPLSDQKPNELSKLIYQLDKVLETAVK